MNAINLADAKARLSELVDRVAAGDVIEITRRGKPIARLSPVNTPRKAIALSSLQQLTGKMLPGTIDPATMVREMRDGDRY